MMSKELLLERKIGELRKIFDGDIELIIRSTGGRPVIIQATRILDTEPPEHDEDAEAPRSWRRHPRIEPERRPDYCG